MTAIVSREMATLLWPNADPIGKRFRLGGDSTFMTVVGVVNDIRARGFNDTPEPTMYFPYPQTRETAYFMPRSMNLVVRTAGDPLAIANQVKAIVRSLDATVPVSDVRTLEQVVGISVANRRFSTALLGAFAALALVLGGHRDLRRDLVRRVGAPLRDRRAHGARRRAFGGAQRRCSVTAFEWRSWASR